MGKACTRRVAAATGKIAFAETRFDDLCDIKGGGSSFSPSGAAGKRIAEVLGSVFQASRWLLQPLQHLSASRVYGSGEGQKH